MPRTTLSVTDDAYDALDTHRRDDESWSECFARIAAEFDDTEYGPQTVSVDNVDEIARAAADEVENRMTRR